MKIWGCLVLLLACLITFASAEEERSMTVMVYMCGSNLESGYGVASDDLIEMRGAGLNSRETAVLVMTGGSSFWSAGFDASAAAIHEVSRKGIRTVWSGEAMNMGESGTLSSLLRFGAEQYPADRYALILWDHGAGPMEGLCWDELFSMDHLSLTELTRALEDAGLPERLEFIGFDACLMSSVEVACAVAPYARYMIASQETEPAQGWNYGFLSSLGREKSGADIGREIVRTYGEESGKDPFRTLSCIDLDRMPTVVEEMEKLFSETGVRMTQKEYVLLSTARDKSAAFGEGVSMFGSRGYDLVDLGDFASRLRDGENLNEAVHDAVVAQVSTEAGTSGLSIYHPYQNRTEYENSWREAYEELGIGEAYKRYIQEFGRYLTGEELCRWTGLVPSETLGDGHVFSLPLSDIQKENVAGARLLVLQSLRGKAGKDLFVLLNTLPAEQDGDGLKAVYAPGKLYGRLEDGTMFGPVTVFASDDDRQLLAIGMYEKANGMDTDMHAEDVHAVYVFEKPLRPGKVEPVSILVYDPATRQFTTRIPLREAEFDHVNLWNIDRILPGEDVEELPAFQAWEADNGFMSWFRVDLPQKWEFVYTEDDLAAADLYAAFEITDMQQQVWCSRPIPLTGREEDAFRTEQVQTDQAQVYFTGRIRGTELGGGFYLGCEVENTEEVPMDYALKDLVLNGRRRIRGNLYVFEVEGGKSMGREFKVPEIEMAGMETLTEIEAVIQWRRHGETGWNPGATVRASLSPFNLSPIAWKGPVLARAEQDGTSVEILEFSKADHAFSGNMLIRNQSGGDIDLSTWRILPEGIQTTQTVSPGYLEAGMETVAEFSVENSLRLSWLQTDTDYDMGDGVLASSVLEDRDIQAVKELRLIMGQDPAEGEAGREAVLLLDTPLELEGTGEAETPLLIYEDACIRVEAVNICAASHTAALGLAIANRTSVPLYMEIRNGKANGVEVRMDVSAAPVSGFLLAPGSIRYTSCVYRNVEEKEISELSAGIRWWGSGEVLNQEALRMISVFGMWTDMDHWLEGIELVEPEKAEFCLRLREPEAIPENQWMTVPPGKMRMENP